MCAVLRLGVCAVLRLWSVCCTEAVGRVPVLRLWSVCCTEAVGVCVRLLY